MNNSEPNTSIPNSEQSEQIIQPRIIETYPVSAIVLAAGLSQRMGKKNKLLLEVGTQTLIEKVVETVLMSKIEEVVVVLGHEAIKIQRVLRGKAVKMVKNPLYQLGMTTSIQAGVQATSKESKGYMIVLGDLAQIEVTELDLLIEAFQNVIEVSHKKEEAESSTIENSSFVEDVIIEGSAKLHLSPIVIPVFEGRKGNPVIFSDYFREAILQHSNMNGCKGIIEEHSDCVITVEMPNNHVLKDVDTPEDYDLVIGDS